MKRLVIVSLCLVFCACLCMSDNALKNGNFAQANAANATLPANWSVPDDGEWQLAKVGPNGEQCLESLTVFFRT